MSAEYLQEESSVEPCAAAGRTAVNERTRVVSAEPQSTPAAREALIVLKFGGTSLLGADRMLHAASLVRTASRSSSVVVVVSAMKGVTDDLLSVAHLLADSKSSVARQQAESVVRLHFEVLENLRLYEEQYKTVRRGLDLLARDLLHEVRHQGSVTANAELCDRLASFGERFSSRLFAAALEKSGVTAVPVCSSDFVLTCDTFRAAKPHLDQTKERGRAILLPLLEEDVVPVVTGFIGATPDGRITTLGRNSSDYSGAIVAHVVDAEELVIWTDVDGVYTSNPHDSSEAQLLHDLSYDEAHALAASGAKVIHPHVLPLAAEAEMTVWIRNTFKPHARGTRIGVPSCSRESAQAGGAA